ncbi:MAG: hypothetical protein CFH41_01635 [Alphaproteobacteria bacterium MarineAlpha11_Bin1]|nr:MAG: hypothetical protein CFH41_01635 [Alphaproteobacteria bacterium MarineAlpha11_Bin1]
MTQISFYHLLYTPFERAFPKLIEKILEGGENAVIKTGSIERAEVLSGVLWTYDQSSFLPHGTARDGNADKQPIWITPDDENPNGSSILVLTDGAAVDDLGAWDRCLEMFDGRDEAALVEARRHWSLYKAAEHDLIYWQQKVGGGWEQQI